MIQIMLLPHPPHPVPEHRSTQQFVAAKSLMVNSSGIIFTLPVYASWHGQTFTLKMKNVAVHSRQKQLLKEKFYMDRT